MRTTHGVPLEVLDPGLINKDAGPDFLHAKIKLGQTIWVGHVEIHVHSSDWFVHRHQLDKAYDVVVLHVVEEADCEVQNTFGEDIPQLQISVPAYVMAHYNELRQTSDFPRCYKILPDLSSLIVHSWMNALLVERMHDRELQILNRLKQVNDYWSDCFFATLARSMGAGLNGDAFDKWASILPFRAVDKHADNQMQVEAIFLGVAGLLQHPQDSYEQQLQKEYSYLSHKFGMKEMDASLWKLLRTRPANFPSNRLLQLAHLYIQRKFTLSALLECKSLEEVYQLMNEDAFQGLAHNTKTLIIINAVIPVLVTYCKHRNLDPQSYLAWLEQLPPEQNRFIRLWDKCGIHPEHAADSQALIQLKKNYCDERKCLYCKFGYYYLSRKNE